MPTKEAPQELVTFNFPFKDFKKYEVLVAPDPGGRLEPESPFNNTRVLFKPTDRIPATPEPQEPESKLIEMAPNLMTNSIPKWDMVAEIGRLLSDVNTGLAEGKSLFEAVSKSAKELEMNIRTYDGEIIKSRAVLLHLNRFDLVNGTVRMVGNNGKPVVDSVSPQERKGAVLDASTQIENSLIAAENNTLAVLMNPAGWHGFTDQYGRDLSPHSNAQVLVFYKDKKRGLQGLTFHVDLELEQAKNVMLSLGVSEDVLIGITERDQIVNIVRNPALLSLPEAYDNPFEFVLDQILAERGNQAFRLLQEGDKEEIRPVDEVRADIQRFEALLQVNQAEEQHIAELVSYILTQALKIDEQEVQQQIIYQIEKTLLNLTRVYLRDSGQMPILQSNVVLPKVYGRQLAEWGDNFAREIAYLQTRRGCPPSSTNSLALSGISLGSSSGSVGGSGIVERDADGPLEFACHNCHKVNNRPRNGRRPSCKWCGVKFSGC